MNAKRELVVALEEIRGIRYTCPICRRKILMSLDGIQTFYEWADRKQFCPECGRDTGDLVRWVDEYKDLLHTLAGMVVGRSDLKRLDVALIVDTP